MLFTLEDILSLSIIKYSNSDKKNLGKVTISKSALIIN